MSDKEKDEEPTISKAMIFALILLAIAVVAVIFVFGHPLLGIQIFKHYPIP